jgi:protein-L-isoaspartate O-methyltransferase
VTTVEIDPTCTTTSPLACARLGVQPTLVLGDSAGHCDRGGYDRVLVAHHMDHVPPAWATERRTRSPCGPVRGTAAGGSGMAARRGAT